MIQKVRDRARNYLCSEAGFAKEVFIGMIFTVDADDMTGGVVSGVDKDDVKEAIEARVATELEKDGINCIHSWQNEIGSEDYYPVEQNIQYGTVPWGRIYTTPMNTVINFSEMV